MSINLKKVGGKFEGYRDKYEYHVPDGKQKNQRFIVPSPKTRKKTGIGIR